MNILNNGISVQDGFEKKMGQNEKKVPAKNKNIKLTIGEGILYADHRVKEILL